MEPTDPIIEENKRMRRLRIIVDLVATVLAQEKMSIDEALDLVNATKRTVLGMFPGNEAVYDMIYGRRFARILKERFSSENDEQTFFDMGDSPSDAESH